MTKREIKNESKDKRTTKKDRHFNKSKEENDNLVFIRRTSCQQDKEERQILTKLKQERKL